MKDEKIKRCPFCGGEAKIKQSEYLKTFWGVQCSDRECPGSHSMVFNGKEEAIAAWNRRDLEEEHREQLVQELEDLKRVQGDPSTLYGIQLAIGKIKEQAQ